MNIISKKTALAASALALFAFVGGIMTPTPAEAAIGLKIPKIKVPVGSAKKGDTANQAAPTTKAKSFSGRAQFNNTGNYKPAAGFDVYLIHGNFTYSSSWCKEDGNVLRIFGPGYKIGTTDANGNYSGPIPPNAKDFANSTRFPEVKIMFFKPGFGSHHVSVTYQFIGEFLKVENISNWNPRTYLTKIVFED